jgi:hypothetical protein
VQLNDGSPFTFADGAVLTIISSTEQVARIPGSNSASWILMAEIDPGPTGNAPCNQITNNQGEIVNSNRLRIRVTLSSQGPPRNGTVILTGGGHGNRWYIDLADEAGPIGDFVSELLSRGYDIVEVCSENGIWSYPDMDSYGAIELSSRYAYVVHAIAEATNNNYWTGRKMIAQGNCAGSAQIAFGLCYHGLSDHLDIVNLGSPLPPCPRCPENPNSLIEGRQAPSDIVIDQEVPDELRNILKLIVRPIVDRLDDLYQIQYKAERDFEQLVAYIAIRGLENLPSGAIGGLQPFAFEAWARVAQPLLLRNPNLTYRSTDVNFFIGEHEGLPFIWEMSRLYHSRIYARSSTYHLIADCGHPMYDYRSALMQMLSHIP